jgi:hypothetical protein
MKWISMAEHKSLRSPCAMPSVGWSVLKLAAIGLWSDESRFTIWQSMEESGFGGCQENATCPNE